MKYLKDIDLASIAFVSMMVKLIAFQANGSQIVDSVVFCAISAVLAYNLHLKSKKKVELEKKIEEEVMKVRQDFAEEMNVLRSEVGKMKMSTTQKKPFKF